MATAEDPDIVTVQQFAEQYRVDASVVRGWVRNGYVDYVLVGPRKMRRIRKSDLLAPIEPRKSATLVSQHDLEGDREVLVNKLIANNGMSMEVAVDLVHQMDNDSIQSMLLELVEVTPQEPEDDITEIATDEEDADTEAADAEGGTDIDRQAGSAGDRGPSDSDAGRGQDRSNKRNKGNPRHPSKNKKG